MTSLTPIFDAVLADSEPDLFLASNIFPRPGLAAEWVREFLDIELTPWQRLIMDRPDPRFKAKVIGHFPDALKGHRVLREQAIVWAAP